MYKILAMSAALLATSVAAEEIRIVPDIKRELPTYISEPDLYSEPSFNPLEFGEDYLTGWAEAKVKLPETLSSIERVCINILHAEKPDSSVPHPQSGVVIYTYKTNQSGNKFFNTTIGDRVQQKRVSEHCFDESPWVYQNWLADKEILFTPYNSSGVEIEKVEVVVRGDLSHSDEPSEYVLEYFDFIKTSGMGQASSFFHRDAITELQATFVQALREDKPNAMSIKWFTYGYDKSPEDIESMDPYDFMNRLLAMSEKPALKSVKIINEFGTGSKKHIVIEKVESVFEEDLTLFEVVTLEQRAGQWKLEIPRQLAIILNH